MKKAVILSGVLIIVIAIAIFGGRAFKLGGKGSFLSGAEQEVSYPKSWYYLQGEVLSGPHNINGDNQCTEEGSPGEPWSALTTKQVNVYTSGGQENIDWKYAPLGRDGVSNTADTTGCVSGEWYYDWGNGKMTAHEGYTMANDSQPWCALQTQTRDVYISGTGVMGQDWEYCKAKERLKIDAMPEERGEIDVAVDDSADSPVRGDLQEPLETIPQATGKLSPGMMILAKCQNMYSNCDFSYFEKAFSQNNIVTTDFAKFYIAKKEEGGTVDMKNIFTIANQLYSQITEQQAQEIAELLLLGAQKKQFNVVDANLKQEFKSGGIGSSNKMSADASDLQAQQSGGGGSDLDGLLAIKKMIDAGQLTNLDLGKGNSGSKEGNTEETSKASQGGDTPKVGSFSGGGGMNFSAGAASCANAAKGKGGLGSSPSGKTGDSGSSGGAVGGGDKGGQISGGKTYDESGGGGSGGGAPKFQEIGGKPSCAPGSSMPECKKGAPKKPKENFAGGAGSGSAEDEESNNNKEGGGKEASCQAVNWDALEGGGGQLSADNPVPEGGTKEVTQSNREITNSNGEKTEVNKKESVVRDEKGKEVSKETKYTVEHPSGDVESKTFNDKNDPTGSKEKDFVKEMKSEANEGGAGQDSGWEKGKTNTFDSKGNRVGMADPSVETAKSNLKKCDSSWASAHNACVMNILLDEFKNKDGLSNCDVKGMPGEEGGACKKKQYGKEGLNSAEFFGTGSSQGAGVTDPGFGN